MRNLTQKEQIMRLFSMIHAKTRRENKPPEPPENGCPPEVREKDAPRSGHGGGRVLGLLNDNGTMNQVRIAQELEIRPQSLSEALGKLESEGYIIREACPDDRRQTLVTITESGKEKVKIFRERRRQEADSFLSTLTEEEAQQLLALLIKVDESNKNR